MTPFFPPDTHVRSWDNNPLKTSENWVQVRRGLSLVHIYAFVWHVDKSYDFMGTSHIGEYPPIEWECTASGTYFMHSYNSLIGSIEV